MILFTILIASFLISNYFNKQKIDDNLRYKNKDYYKTGFIFSIVGWVLIFISKFTNSVYLFYLGLVLLSLSLFKELIFSFIRINYYNKVLKEVKEDQKKEIKKNMEIDSIKRIFYLLSSPLLTIQKMFNYLLEKIF